MECGADATGLVVADATGLVVADATGLVVADATCYCMVNRGHLSFGNSTLPLLSTGDCGIFAMQPKSG